MAKRFLREDIAEMVLIMSVEENRPRIDATMAASLLVEALDKCQDDLPEEDFATILGVAAYLVAECVDKSQWDCAGGVT